MIRERVYMMLLCWNCWILWLLDAVLHIGPFDLNCQLCWSINYWEILLNSSTTFKKKKKVGLKLNVQKTKIRASSPITSWQIDGETMETVTDFIFLGSKITADGDCNHEIKRCLLLGSIAMTNLYHMDHNKLWKILKEMGIPDHLTCLLRNLYAGRESTVRTGRRTTDWFQIEKGVHQGCKLSSCLFNLEKAIAPHSGTLAWKIPWM